MGAPLRVGLLGAGPWAANVIGPVLAAGPETTLVGVWSRNVTKAEGLATSLRSEAFADPDALIAAADAVSWAAGANAKLAKGRADTDAKSNG